MMNHPCFSIEAAHKFARLHLPVAPECNIKCSYCNRKFDCVNESRPGVTSAVLSPESALERFQAMKEKFPNLKIVGIAGPGDALANPEATFKTLRLIRECDKEIDFCFSTNGVSLTKYLKEIKEIDIKYITITVNSRRVEIARTLYRWAQDGDIFLKGANAAKFILEKQEEALDALKGSGIHLKINTVYIPGVNDIEVEDIARFAKDKGADILNLMPVVPTPGTYFANFPMVSRKSLNKIQQEMSAILPQMRHCQQCRADAVGNLLNETPIFHTKHLHLRGVNKVEGEVFRFAVASTNGYIVDQHFGHARDLLIYDTSAETIKFIERREITKYCLNPEDCQDADERMRIIEKQLLDCRGLLVMRIGNRPRKTLEERGLYLNMTCNRIEEALRENYNIIKTGGVMPAYKYHLLVCTSSKPMGEPKGYCQNNEGKEIIQELIEELEERDLMSDCLISNTGCFGICDKGPIMVVYPEGVWYGKVSADDVGEIVEKHLEEGAPVERLRIN